ncbi:MAG: CHRD domain-containing protein [Burkholderiaceae bacterium]|jgi:hypothetical protein|nr:CHRD domain-containing protein [Burkholderiaceae bacterium]
MSKAGLFRWYRWATLVMASALAATLSGCVVVPFYSTYPVETSPPPRKAPPKHRRQAELAALKAVLTGRKAVPPANSLARGELVGVLNRNTGLFRWKLNYSGLSGPIRSANFHAPAANGRTAAPVLPVGGSDIRSPYEGRATLSPDQIKTLLAGRWYVNLSTERFPSGELRGQLIEQH